MRAVILCAALAAAPVGGAESFLDQLPLDDEFQAQWALPSRLREISGLATTGDGRLLAIDDEKAIVYELDYVHGRLVKAFALGNPVLRGDFEGIAVVADTVWLLTSDGVLYAAPEGGDGERVGYRRIDTRLGEQCEFEGLAHDRLGSRLLLLCKDVKATASIDTVAIFPWRLDDRTVAFDERIELPITEISLKLRTRHLHPSGIVVHPERHALLIVAARERALIELDEDGGFVNAIMFPQRERHPQAEGIEVGAAGQLIIADEARNGPPRLTLYAPSQSPTTTRND